MMPRGPPRARTGRARGPRPAGIHREAGLREHSGMERVPEPELMSDAEQARAYAAADFSEPHDRFVQLLAERLYGLPESGLAADLGCGPGDIAFRFARRFPGWTLDAVDGSAAMLALGRRAAAERGLAGRVRFLERRLPSAAPGTPYALLFSNSLLHHLSDPAVLWSTLRQWGSPGSAAFAMDLLRPASRADAEALVARYAAAEPEVLRRDFLHSLLAAYRPDEVRAQLERAGLARLQLEVVSDRHFIVWGAL
jgi:trans-aconitate methyltransferase